MKIIKIKGYSAIAIGCVALLCNACSIGKKSATHPGSITGETAMDWIGLSKEGSHFIFKASGNKFTVWGLNYDRDDSGRLIEDYWDHEWQTVIEDFEEMKQLGANVIRIHLQLGKFMDAPQRPNTLALKQLARLISLAETTGIYLDITGLGNYHKQDVPEWFHTMAEADRWNVQAEFWKAVAGVCAGSPAIFCYDLMNEPLWPSSSKETEWLAGELGGKFYCQRITLDLGKREAKEVAAQWVNKLVTAIRSQDNSHLITLGAIPLAQVFPGAKPMFYSGQVSKNLDFVSIHFYPKGGEDVSKQIKILEVYDIGKPLLIEEIFPMTCTMEELNNFVDSSRHLAEGWIGFYWGKKRADYPDDGYPGSLIRHWLEYFQKKAPDIHKR